MTNNKFTFPAIISGAVAIASISFSAGLNWAESRCQDRILELNHNFALDEVHGLRSDMNREVQVAKELNELKERLLKCETGR